MAHKDIDNVVTLNKRRDIVMWLKYGICPFCGRDTGRKYSHKEQIVMTYCTNTSCKFCDKSYRDVYKWLVHHSL